MKETRHMRPCTDRPHFTRSFGTGGALLDRWTDLREHKELPGQRWGQGHGLPTGPFVGTHKPWAVTLCFTNGSVGDLGVSVALRLISTEATAQVPLSPLRMPTL